MVVEYRVPEDVRLLIRHVVTRASKQVDQVFTSMIVVTRPWVVNQGHAHAARTCRFRAVVTSSRVNAAFIGAC